MLVRFVGVNEWYDQSKTIDLPSVPQVGDYVELEVGSHQACVRTVVWILTEPVPTAYVIIGNRRVNSDED